MQEMWKGGISYGGKQRIGGDLKKTVKSNEIVYMFKDSRKKGGMPHREKSTAKQHMAKKARRCSKRRGS